MPSTKVSRALILSILAIFFFWFVWPTPYHFTEMKVGNNVLPVRINRITGETEMLYPTGWGRLDDESGESTKKPQSTMLPDSLLRKLEARGEFSNQFFEITLYNPTSWTIEELKVKLVVRNADGSVQITRDYIVPRKYPVIGGRPLSSSKFSTQVGFQPLPFEKWSCTILEAKGLQERFWPELIWAAAYNKRHYDTHTLCNAKEKLVENHRVRSIGKHSSARGGFIHWALPARTTEN